MASTKEINEARGRRLRWARKALSPYRTATKASEVLGVHEKTYIGHENGHRGMKAAVAQSYADFYEIDVGWLLFNRGAPRAGVLAPDEAQLKAAADDDGDVVPYSPPPQSFQEAAPQGGYRPPPRLLGADDLPIYTGAEGGPGELILETEPFDYMPMPYMLEDVKGAYGIYIVGESMVPSYRPGDVALVHPRLPPIRDAEAIFYASDPRLGEARASIKTLQRWDDSKWMVQQLNPAKSFSLPKKTWQFVHRVVGKFSRR